MDATQAAEEGAWVLTVARDYATAAYEALRGSMTVWWWTCGEPDPRVLL